jgi:vanillate O-demethylase ferredoxin subunit
VRLLSLQGAIDHRDVFYSERQQHAAAKMCCCVSRAVSSETGSRAGSAGECAVVTIDV